MRYLRDAAHVCAGGDGDGARRLFIQFVQHIFCSGGAETWNSPHHFARRCSSALFSTSARSAADRRLRGIWMLHQLPGAFTLTTGHTQLNCQISRVSEVMRFGIASERQASSSTSFIASAKAS
jgi:hypothetical protein